MAMIGLINALCISTVIYGPYNLNKKDFLNDLKELLLGLKPEKGKNIIVSAHNMMITDEILDGSANEKEAPIDPAKFGVGLEEGGFWTLKVEEGKLIYVAKFHTFQGFAKTFMKRPAN